MKRIHATRKGPGRKSGHGHVVRPSGTKFLRDAVNFAAGKKGRVRLSLAR